MSEIAIDYHGWPLDEDGKPLSGEKWIHVRLFFTRDEDALPPFYFGELTAVQNLAEHEAA